LRAIAMVEATVERDGAITTARRFFLSSLALDARMLARAVRAHCGIENRLHWVLDVVFHDDLMRLRTEHGPKNMATIKHRQPQGQAQSRSLEPALPPGSHHKNRSVTFKRFPWVA
jgi:predicted transposase YbfD/YdcC